MKSNLRAFLASTASLLILLAAPPVLAQEATPGTACSTAGAFTRSGGPELAGAGHFMVCSGGVWVGAISYSSTGTVGIGVASPQTNLDVAGALRIAYDSQSCAAASEGGIRYNSATDTFEICKTAGSWTNLQGASAAGANTQLQFNNGGALGASANLTWDGSTLAASHASTTANMKAVHGAATATSGTTYGVYGSSASNAGFGVAGYNSNGGIAVLGESNADSSMAIEGYTNGADSVGVHGWAASTSGTNFGIWGRIDSTTAAAAAVYGRAYGTSGATYGVYGRNDSTTAAAAAVYGRAQGTSGATYGVQGRTDSTSADAAGVYGRAAGTSGANYGVYGTSASATGSGGYFTNTNGGSALVTQTGTVGIGTTTPQAPLHVAGEALIGKGSLACGAAQDGALRFTSATDAWEFCNGSAWTAFASGATTLDQLTDAFTIYDAGTTSNIILGRSAAAALTAGAVHNLFIGEQAGATTANSSSATDRNIAIGYQALAALTTGDSNLAIGPAALAANTTGLGNVAVGYNALATNVAKQNSTAIGFEAMRYAYSSSSAGPAHNTAIGYQALRGGTTAGSNSGTNNTVIGALAGQMMTSGGDNTLVGYRAGKELIDGTSNTILGTQAGEELTSGSDNVFIGEAAGQENQTGGRSVAVGKSALKEFNPATSSASNTAVGYHAMYGVAGSSTGIRNTVLGMQAGDSLTTGSDNILIGYNIDTPAATTSSHLNIGNTIYGDLATGRIAIGTTTPQAPLHVAGEAIIGKGSLACGAAQDGALRFTSATDAWEFCNGSAWVPFERAATFSGPADCPNIGDQCSDTTIFAGYHPSLHQRMFLHPNNQSTAAAWRSSGSGSDTGAVNHADGKINHDWIVANRTIANYPAFKLCNDLNLASALGHTDWYLPSSSELYYLFSVYQTLNAGAGDDFVVTEYWSSTEYDSSNGLWQRFSSGRLTDSSKSSSADVRCIRRG